LAVRHDGSPALTIAGLWDQWRDRASGETLKSCTMIITEPNGFVGEVHDRMPVLLAEDQFEPWLSGAAGVVQTLRNVTLCISSSSHRPAVASLP